MVEHINYSTGSKGKEFASFNGLLTGKLLLKGINEFAFAIAGFKLRRHSIAESPGPPGLIRNKMIKEKTKPLF